MTNIVAQHLLRAAVAIALMAFDIGCGGGTTGVGGTGGMATGGTSGTGGGTSGTGGGISGTGGGTYAGCPSTPPADGSHCTPIQPADAGFFNMSAADCSWGNDPRPSCRTTAVCTNNAWKVTQDSCTTPALDPSCPNPPPADTAVCPNTMMSCWYADGTRCWCSGCKGGSGYPSCQVINPPEWYCAQPGTGCPVVMPQAGTRCTTEGASCGPNCELEIRCVGGVWRWYKGSCPICAAPTTPIATPEGEREIASLRVGDLVYSVERGAIVAVPITRVGKTRVAGHHVMRVVLDTGRVLEISAGHPTADGRTFAELSAGGLLDEQHRIRSAELVPYAYDATYDILPASSSATYFAAGALIGSTLAVK